MLAAHNRGRAPFASLPNDPIVRIFQLVCDSCPPDTPGTCWLAPVCKQWRSLACHVKRLRVLFPWQQQQQQVDSFCAWLGRHAPQVKALAISSMDVTPVLRVLAGPVGSTITTPSSSNPTTSSSSSSGDKPAAPVTAGVAIAAQAAGTPLPLEHLVISCGEYGPEMCYDTLGPLLGALPHLQHLNLDLLVESPKCDKVAVAAATAALAPLQHSTSLTSLVLDGPWNMNQGDSAAVCRQLLAGMPASLCSLTWRVEWHSDLEGVTFGHLPALGHLSLRGDGVPSSADAFASLPAQCKLALQKPPWSSLAADGVPQVYKGQLVRLGLDHCWITEYDPDMHDYYFWDQDEYEEEEEGANDPQVLSQLTALQSLHIKTGRDKSTRALLRQAPPLKELKVQLPEQTARWTNTPSVLRQYNSLEQLQRLSLTVHDPQPAPLELRTLKKLQQLRIHFKDWCTRDQPNPSSWAQAVARLVNLQVLRVPVELTTSGPPCWLTGLTRLVVLEVKGPLTLSRTNPQQFDQETAAAHISSFLAPSLAAAAPSAAGAAAAAPSAARARLLQNDSVQVVCFYSGGERNAQLQEAVTAAVPVLPPSKHLFNGSWQQLQEFGVKLWPEPVAARLQQLV